MATLTLKNVPDDLYKALKEAAAKNRRSLNQEAILRLEQAVPGKAERDPEEIIARLRRFQATIPPEKRAATREEIDRWKREGRA